MLAGVAAGVETATIEVEEGARVATDEEEGATTGTTAEEEAATATAATDDTAAEFEVAVVPEDGKLLAAVTEAPELIPTLFTVTTSPSELVTRTFTVVVPNPLAFSKKL